MQHDHDQDPLQEEQLDLNTTQRLCETISEHLQAVSHGLDEPTFNPQPILRTVSLLFKQVAKTLHEFPDLTVTLFRGLHDALMKDAATQHAGGCRLKLAQTELTVIIGHIYSEELWAFDYGNEKDFSLADAILHWQAHAHVPVDLLTIFEEALGDCDTTAASQPDQNQPEPRQ
jgi:hypothetical protein